ncbi:hypothetical protein PK28_10560 [Hymenobacter sp. DG25B]|uniref:hypothetical protein n=1 Tax=Hymenobacter sp. DG25B TaxID=1385664 RepID=UPI000540F954|nr:hypothetical protein [Hymenobacter sp. DG25B]AIZ64024.1 hypothetical protein PK28_10560 [Hymenobacter sp. DG25B]
MITRFTLILSLLLLFSSSISAQETQWQKVDLGDSVTVDFPGQATMLEVQGQKAYRLIDGETIYLAVVQQNSYKVNPSSAELDEFYNGVIKGILDVVENGKVISKRPFTIAGYDGLDLQISTPDRADLPAVKFMRILQINGNGYTLHYYTSEAGEKAEDSKANRTKFFASLQPATNKESNSSLESAKESSAYKLGHIMGKVFFYGLLIAGGFFIVRRFRRA